MEDFVHPTQPTTATEPVDHTDPSQESTPTASTTSTSNTSTAAAAADGPVIDAKLQEQHLYLEETRTVNHGEIKSGWKSDFSGRGKIELVADISAMHLSSGLVRNITKKSSYESLPKDDGLRNGANISCDIDDPQLGVFVQHTLIVELVIAEELLQNEHKRSMNGIRPSISNNGLRPVTSTNSVLSNDSSTGIHPIASNSTTNSHSHTPHTLGTPSGAARVLRMQFKLPFTERSGLGIAWDDEVPPTYEDIRALSPPTYADSSLEGTPIFGGLTEGSNSNLGTPRRVLYGVGNTPATGPFGLEANMGSGIDNMVDLDERIQEFTL